MRPLRKIRILGREYYTRSAPRDVAAALRRLGIAEHVANACLEPDDRPNLEHADLRPRDAGAAPAPNPPPSEINMRPVTGADKRTVWIPE